MKTANYYPQQDFNSVLDKHFKSFKRIQKAQHKTERRAKRELRKSHQSVHKLLHEEPPAVKARLRQGRFRTTPGTLSQPVPIGPLNSQELPRLKREFGNKRVALETPQSSERITTGRPLSLSPCEFKQHKSLFGSKAMAAVVATADFGHAGKTFLTVPTDRIHPCSEERPSPREHQLRYSFGGLLRSTDSNSLLTRRERKLIDLVL